MKMQRLKKVRDAIARAKPRLIDMSGVGMPHCGTPGCIAGWTNAVAGRGRGTLEDAGVYLGIASQGQYHLFMGKFSPFEISLAKVTKDEVLRAIDIVIEAENVPPDLWAQVHPRLAEFDR